jgi:hypothetical protein
LGGASAARTAGASAAARTIAREASFVFMTGNTPVRTLWIGAPETDPPAGVRFGPEPKRGDPP